LRTEILNLFLSHIDEEEKEFVKKELNLNHISSFCCTGSPLKFYEMYDLIATTFPVDRKRGRYFTPKDIAELLIKFLNIDNEMTILEPAAGLGIFLFKLLDVSEIFSLDKKDILSKVTIIEKDTLLFFALKLLLLHYIFMNKIDISINEIDIRNTDFLTLNLKNKYSIILGNPPFVDTKFLPNRLTYKSLYPLTNRNLFSMFLEKALDLIKDNGEIAFIVSESFIYLKSYNNLRKMILDSKFDISVYKLSKNIFFKANVRSIILHLRDSNKGNISVSSPSGTTILQKRDLYVKDYILPFNDFEREILNILDENENLSHYVEIMVGLQTNNVRRYILKNRMEGSLPYIKRLKRRKGYWQTFSHWLLFNKLVKEKPDVVKERHLRAMKQEGIVFNNIDNNSAFIAVYKPKGYLFDIVTPCIIPIDTNLYYLLAYLNSNFAKYILYKLNGTPHTNINDVIKLPYNTKYDDNISYLTKRIIENLRKGNDINSLHNKINHLIYKQFGITSGLIHKMEMELYNNGIIFDKTK